MTREAERKRLVELCENVVLCGSFEAELGEEPKQSEKNQEKLLTKL